MATETITIKIKTDMHQKLSKAHAKAIGKAGRAMSFQAFVDSILESGIRAQRLDRK